MSVEYQDPRITCTEDRIEIHGYYFPWGTKHVRYDAVRAIRRVNLGALTGRGRIWGTSNPSRWANFDHRRPSKTVGFDIDVGARVKPLVTPDDPDAFEHVVRAHLDPDVVSQGGRRSSII